jgi:hypothetical protein
MHCIATYSGNMSQSEPTDTSMTDAPATTSISAAAHHYQMAMSQQEAAQAPQSVDYAGTALEPSGDGIVNGSNSDMIDVYHPINT